VRSSLEGVRRRGLATWLALAAAGSLLACGEERPASRPGPSEPEPEIEVPAEVDRGERTGGPAPDDDPPGEPAAAEPPDVPDAPESGCAFADPVRAHGRPAWVDVAAAGDGFLIAGSAPAEDGEEAFLVRVGAGEAPRTAARAALEHPVPRERRRAPPALAIAGSRAALALVDGEHRLLLATFDPRSPGTLALAPVADGASLRFAPALAARGDGWAVAWTDERDTPMRVRGALADPGGRRRGDPMDLTPTAGGAAAPAFVEGATPPVLMHIDPRQGMSVSHRVPLTGDGFGEPEVARPVSLVAEPSETAAVRLGRTDWLGYTAVGDVATTAVGLVRLEGTAPAAPLVRGTGYGVLHVDAARLGEGAVFVADAPQGSPPSSPRELHVRTVSAGGTAGEPAVVVGPSGAASRGRVAVAGRAVAATFAGADGTYVAIGRCVPP